MTPRWWSESKQRYVALADMPTPHLVAAFRKHARGEYAPPDEPSDADRALLERAFEDELARRRVALTAEGYEQEGA